MLCSQCGTEHPATAHFCGQCGHGLASAGAAPSGSAAPAAGRSGKSVFISHSSKDKRVAFELCDRLEKAGIPCWIAPRDVSAGQSYGDAIIDGLQQCSVCLLLLSESSNQSQAVINEVERAFSYQKLIVPLRIRAVMPAKGLEFFISNAQWVDAYASPIADRVEYIAAVVRAAEAQRQAPPPAPQRRGLGASMAYWRENVARHKWAAASVSLLVLAGFGLAGMTLQGEVHSSLQEVQASLTEVKQAQSAVKDVKQVQASLQEVQSSLKEVKQETSSNPRKELANRGVSWSDKGFGDALMNGDTETLELFFAAGWNPMSKYSEEGNALGDFLWTTSVSDPAKVERILKLFVDKGIDPNANRVLFRGYPAVDMASAAAAGCNAVALEAALKLGGSKSKALETINSQHNGAISTADGSGVGSCDTNAKKIGSLLGVSFTCGAAAWDPNRTLCRLDPQG